MHHFISCLSKYNSPHAQLHRNEANRLYARLPGQIKILPKSDHIRVGINLKIAYFQRVGLQDENAARETLRKAIREIESYPVGANSSQLEELKEKLKSLETS